MNAYPEEFENSRKRIKRIVEEIVFLENRGLEPVQYFSEFLPRLLTCLAAPAGIAWMRTPAGDLQQVYQVNFWQTGLSDPQNWEDHSDLLRCVVQGQRPVMLLPNEQIEARENGGSLATNPTGYVIFLVPIKVDDKVVGLVEVFQNVDRGRAAQHGFFQFIKKMGELASSYAQNTL